MCSNCLSAIHRRVRPTNAEFGNLSVPRKMNIPKNDILVLVVFALVEMFEKKGNELKYNTIHFLSEERDFVLSDSSSLDVRELQPERTLVPFIGGQRAPLYRRKRKSFVSI
jgi:hypothetical protein